MMRRLRSSRSACGTARVKGVVASFMDFFPVSVQLNLLTAEAAADELPACDPRIETACDVLFTNAVAKAPPIRPVPMTTIFFMLFLGLRLADTFNNESVIDCPLLAVLRDTLVCFAIVPIFRRLYVREFCYHDSINGIALQDFVLPIGHQDFNWMSFHCRFNSGPISLKLLLIQCPCSSENDVSGHDCSPFMG